MPSSFLKGFLSILALINPSSAQIVTYQGEELANLVSGNVIDLTKDGNEGSLYVRLCEWTLKDSAGSKTLLSMTRYCYCTQPASMDQTDSTCSYPGPTLLMHSYTSDAGVSLTLVNELVGSTQTYGPTSIGPKGHWNHYKDMDTTNLHVHGLHVSPHVDDIIFAKASPTPKNASDVNDTEVSTSWTYNYKIFYHYPGTYWYHAHHHGSTTWQVNMGLHGAILMNPKDDSRYPESEENKFYDIGKYPQDVLMFQWTYAIGSNICTDPAKGGCSKDLPDDADWTYTTRFTDISKPDPAWKGPRDDFQTCDIWCAMPSDQRSASGYDYDMWVNSDVYPQCTNSQANPDENCMFFFTNGQYQPKLTGVKLNELRRLRMINSMANWYMQMTFPKTCEWYLIATDGIYTDGVNMEYDLSKPSHQNELIMSPGGRADVLYKCTAYGTHTITTSRNTRMDPEQLPMMMPKVYSGRKLLSIQVDGEGPTVAPSPAPTPEPTSKPTPKNTTSPTNVPSPSPTLNATQSPTLSSPELTPAPTLPGTSAYPLKPESSYVGVFTDTDNPATTCEQSDDDDDDECHFHLQLTGATMLINGNSFLDHRTSIIGLTAEQLVKEYKLGLFNINSEGYEFQINNGKTSHPYHQHINPFNVRYAVGQNGFIALPNTWWDTLGNYGIVQNIIARMWTRGSWVYPDDTVVQKAVSEYFGTGGGLIIVHCHMLQHEDQGLMGFYGIINTTSTLSSAEVGDSDSDSAAHIVLYVLLAVIILALIIFAIYYFVKKKSVASETQSNLAQNQSTAGGATAAASGSIESAEAGSTEMASTAK